MITYVALLRGIMPMNPNMKSEKLKAVFESLGFKNVATVIASGNVVFDSPSKDLDALEARIGKDITTRTWKTVDRILKKMEATQKLNASTKTEN
jgi:uncharacterized protein (DUF1697 family)